MGGVTIFLFSMDEGGVGPIVRDSFNSFIGDELCDEEEVLMEILPVSSIPSTIHLSLSNWGRLGISSPHVCSNKFILGVSLSPSP
jgi:hypothetical protein